MGAATRPLVLRILCRLSVWDAAIILLLFLLLVVFLLLFTDQKLLWRPAKLPTLDFSLCRLNHDGWQTIFELTAAVEVWGVWEYLKRKDGGKILLINLSLISGITAIHFLNSRAGWFKLFPIVRQEIIREHIFWSVRYLGYQSSLEPCRSVADTTTRLNNCEGSDVKTKHLWREVVA